MSKFSIQVYKNLNSNKPPEICLPIDLPQSDLINPVLIKTAKDLFDDNGVLVIKNLFSKELISELNQSFFEQYQGYFEDRDRADALEVGVKRKMITVNLQTPFNNPNLYGNPLLMELMTKLIGKDFVLGSFGAVVALPGAEQQHIHQDHPSLFEDEALDLQLPSFAITLVVPLIDLTPATGSTQVWKGSHRLSYSKELENKYSSVPFVPMGSCYLMDYQLWHGGTPNISDQVRPILYIVYYRSWFQETVNYENQARISIAQREYQKIPKTYKSLFVRVQEHFQFSQTISQYEHSQVPSKNLSQSDTSDPPLTPLKKGGDRRRNILLDPPLTPLKKGGDRGLTADQQVKHLSIIAKKAIKEYGFEQAALELISHGENTVFAVDVPDASIPNLKSDRYADSRLILRIHRANYLSINAIESELQWLKFLSQEAQLPVPEPIPTLEGKLFKSIETQDVPEPRVCSLTRCLKGHSFADQGNSNESQLGQLESVGRLLGQLHYHAEHWSIPENFTRPRWDWNGLFGDMAGYSNNGSKVWQLTPHPYRNLFENVSQQFQNMTHVLKDDRSQFGLIHGDFWAGNLLIHQNQIGMIDFADCGFSYWVYDLARFLNDYIYEPDFWLYLDRLLHGYTQIRNLSEEQLSHINLFIAAQYAAYGLWQVNRAQDHPSFRETLEEELQETAIGIEQLMNIARI